MSLTPAHRFERFSLDDTRAYRQMQDRSAARVILHGWTIRYAAENRTTTAQVYAVAGIRQSELDRASFVNRTQGGAR